MLRTCQYHIHANSISLVKIRATNREITFDPRLAELSWIPEKGISLYRARVREENERRSIFTPFDKVNSHTNMNRHFVTPNHQSCSQRRRVAKQTADLGRRCQVQIAPLTVTSVTVTFMYMASCLHIHFLRSQLDVLAYSNTIKTIIWHAEAVTASISWLNLLSLNRKLCNKLCLVKESQYKAKMPSAYSSTFLLSIGCHYNQGLLYCTIVWGKRFVDQTQSCLALFFLQFSPFSFASFLPPF